MPILRITAVWFLILLLAIANGALRETLLVPALGVPAAPMLSGLLLGSAIFLAAWFLLPRSKSSGEPWAIGGLWLALTLVFEFSFGRLVAGKSWAELFAAYRFENGNLWPLILLLTFLAPKLVARWRRTRAPG
jgi:hypothetical protein